MYYFNLVIFALRIKRISFESIAAGGILKIFDNKMFIFVKFIHLITFIYLFLIREEHYSGVKCRSVAEFL